MDRLRERNSDEALTLMRSAADMEDKSEKHAVTPGRLVPARELLGEMLLEMNRPAEALQAFETSEKHDPNRFRGLYGAAKAAALAGEQAKAKAITGSSSCSRKPPTRSGPRSKKHRRFWPRSEFDFRLRRKPCRTICDSGFSIEGCMRKKIFGLALGAFLFALCFLAEAQQPKKVP